MLPRLLRHLRFVKDLTTQHRLLGRHSFQTHAVSRAQIDLYHDVTPFDGGVPREVISFPPPRQTQHEDPSTPFPSLLLPTRKRLSQSNISVSFFLIDKRPGELTDRMALLLSKTFSYKAFLIASSGSLDIMASGLVLFTCGYGLGFLDAFDRLPCTYRGVLKLGQTSESYDLKMPIDRHRPWKHVTGEGPPNAFDRKRSALCQRRKSRRQPKSLLAIFYCHQHRSMLLEAKIPKCSSN